MRLLLLQHRRRKTSAEGHPGHQFLPLNWTLKIPPPSPRHTHWTCGQQETAGTHRLPLTHGCSSYFKLCACTKTQGSLCNCFCHSSNQGSSYSTVALQLQHCTITIKINLMLFNTVCPTVSQEQPQWEAPSFGDRLLHREFHRQHRPTADKALK